MGASQQQAERDVRRREGGIGGDGLAVAGLGREGGCWALVAGRCRRERLALCRQEPGWRCVGESLEGLGRGREGACQL